MHGTVTEFCDEFLRGQQACKDGRKCPVEASEAFQRGYGTEYELEQIKTWESMNDRRKAG